MKRYNRRTLPIAWRNTREWADIDYASLDDRESLRIRTLKDGIVKYLAFEPMGKFLKQHELTMEELLRALNRCVTVASNGTLFGWSGLIPHLRVKPYQRVAPVRRADTYHKGGFSGVLQALFDQHPDIEEKLECFCLTGKRTKKGVPESRITPAIAHRRFTTLCREKGIGDYEWPFICKQEGKPAIANYLKHLFDEHYDEIVERQYGEVAQAKANTGKGIRDEPFCTFGYDVWQLDEHSENVIGAIEVDTPFGPAWFPAGRPQCIAVTDPALSAALGYSLTFARQPESEDILDALDAALGESAPHEFHLEGMHHVTGAGFPAHIDPDLKGYGCAMLEIDNSLVHLASKVIGPIRNRMGCSILFGPVKRFECRAFCESSFGWMERKGFLRCPNTTGTGPHDPRRKRAEEQAVKFKMSPQSLKDLNEALFGKFNAKDEGPYSHTVVDEIRRLMNDEALGFLPTKLLPVTLGEPKLGITIETLPISGAKERGDRPHIYLDYGRYEAKWLSDRFDLVGQLVQVHIDRYQFRVLRVFLPNGYFLGEVTVTGWWSKSEHTRSQRSDIEAFVRQRRGCKTEDSDPMALFLECHTRAMLEKSASKRKKVSDNARALAEAQLHDGYVAAGKGAAAAPLPERSRHSQCDDDVDDDDLPEAVIAIN